MKLLVTGGSGFIGSNFVRYAIKELGHDVVNLDSLTYAGKGKNIEHMKLDLNEKYTFEFGDICDSARVEEVFSKHNPDMVFNFAAESHVDRSISGSKPFLMSNVIGADNIFDAARRHKTKRIIQVSTDEVYGSTKDGSFVEEDGLDPSSPYSASKAAADHLAIAYSKTHNLPITVTRSANNYGPYQFPEKLVPLSATNLIDGGKVKLMWSPENPGLNVRDWLHVKDNCRAIWYVAQNGEDGEAYNIPGENERTNIDITRMLLRNLGKGEDMIEKIPHRLGHDFRYSINGDKLRALGFEYQHKNLEEGIAETVKWYQDNPQWWGPLKK